MAVSRFVNSARARERMMDIRAMPTAGMVKAARTAIMEMTTRSSIRVKAGVVLRVACCAGCCVLRSAFRIPHSELYMGFSSFAQFVFHSFAEPLFDHALVIQKPGLGQPFDAGEQARINAERDGDGLGGFRVAGHRGFHEAEVGLVFSPEIRLGLFAVDDRYFFPFGNRTHRFGYKVTSRITFHFASI